MDAAQRARDSRQILFPGIGERGQEALLRSHAVVVGCGARGERADIAPELSRRE